MKFKIDGNDIEINRSKAGFLINGELVSPKTLDQGNGLFHFIYRNKSFRISLFNKDSKFKVLVNGKRGGVEQVSRVQELLSSIGISEVMTNLASDLKAPMPGKILKVLAASKDEVEKSQNLIVLEAMKMENILKAPVSGDISSISVKEGDTVEKDQILVTFENLK